MRRLAASLALLTTAVVAAACGQGGPAAADRCKPGEAMPAPAIAARQSGYEIRIRYRFSEDACLPWGLNLHVASRDKLDNLGHQKRTVQERERNRWGSVVPLSRRAGSVTYWRPFLHLPPYEVSGTTVGKRNERGGRVTVLVGRRECTARRPVADCIRDARTAFIRCSQGLGRRADCHPRAWRTSPRAATVRFEGDPRKLEASLRESLGNVSYAIERPGAPEDFGRLASLRCPSADRCAAAFRAKLSPAVNFTVRYSIAARAEQTECWIAVRTVVVKRPRDLRMMDRVVAAEGPTQNPHGCLRS